MVDDPKDPRNRVEPISARFNQSLEKEQSQRPAPMERRESDMVKSSAPQMKFEPRGPARDNAHRQQHIADMKKDRDGFADAVIKNSQIRKERAEHVKSMDKDKTMERNRGDDGR